MADDSAIPLWFSATGGPRSDAQAFYDPADFVWASVLENNHAAIREEVEAFLKSNEARVKPYFNKKMVSARNKWKAFGFRFWHWPLNKNGSFCPQTVKLLQQVPGLVSASISIMEPDTEIFPHRGDTNGIYRCHLGLKVPEGLPNCGFKVGEETRPWEEGKLLIFSDSEEHSAWNRSQELRFVLLLDVVKPEYRSKTYRICARVWAGLILQMWRQRWAWFQRSGRGFQRFVYFMMVPWMWCLLRLAGLWR